MDRFFPKKDKGAAGGMPKTTSSIEYDVEMEDVEMNDADYIIQSHQAKFALFKSDLSACQSLNDFMRRFLKDEYTGPQYRHHLLAQSETTAHWQALIVKSAQFYFSILGMRLELMQAKSHSRFLDWLRTAERDLQIFVYTWLIKVVPPWDIGIRELSIQYFITLGALQDYMPKKKETLQLNMKAKAFGQEPCNRDVVTAVYGEILNYYRLFESDKHLSPYTSVVGPSGIGKSYVTSRIAKQGFAYVVYLSFADEDSNSYPGRSVVVDALNPAENDRDKTHKIKEEYKEFQRSVASLLKEFQCKIFDDMKPRSGQPEIPERIRSDQYQQFDHQEYLGKHLDQIGQQARKILKVQQDRLKTSDESSLYLTRRKDNLKAKTGHPLALFCVDEARGLWNPKANPPEMRFLAFRRALRHQSKVTKRRDQKQLFALFLDTSSCVNDFSPPAKDDLSADFLHHTLFPPIWRIDTMDVFVGEVSGSVVQVGHDLGGPRVTIDEVKLFSQARPLWGALMQAGNGSLEYAIGVADSLFDNGKTNTSFDTNYRIDLLALLSYRMNFYVSLPSLAGELASGFLRYIVKVSEDRAFIRTTQPSEPMLAYMPAHKMRQGGGKLRLELVNALFRNATEGFIDVGDIGEAVAAFVLLFSFDRIHSLSLKGQDPSVNVQCIPLTKFLSASLPSAIFSEMKSRVNSKDEMKPLWGGYVFFNHMVKVTEDPTAEILRLAFNRGAAILLPPNFPGADISIPVFIPEDNEISYLIIQVKNRKDDSIIHGNTRTDADPGMKTALRRLPKVKTHLALMMCLRCIQGGSEVLYPKKITQGLKARADFPYRWDNMNRIVVLLCGLNLKLYPGLRFDDKVTESGVKESLDVMKEMLWCTAEEMGEENTPYYQHLKPLK